MKKKADLIQAIKEYNPYHEPAGTPIGGQFAHGNGNGIASHNEPLPNVGRAGDVDIPSGRIKGLKFTSDYQGGDVAGAVKDKICKEIAEEAGVNYYDVDQVLASWADSATSMNSCLVHKTIADEMGYDLRGDVLQHLIDKGIKPNVPITEQDDRVDMAWQWDGGILDRAFGPGVSTAIARQRLEPMTGQRLQKIVTTIYERTQDSLAKQGIGKYDYVNVMRGMIYEAANDRLSLHSQGDTVGYGGNPVASWSTWLPTARAFGEGGHAQRVGLENGYVIETNVPRWAIFSTAMTGIGCLREQEVLVFGDDLQHMVRLVEVYRGE